MDISTVIFLVYEDIQEAFLDTKFVDISLLEVKLLNIQYMRGTHNFGDSVDACISVNLCLLDSLVLSMFLIPSNVSCQMKCNPTGSI